jgi:transcriptional regulator with XRE-family HTH domain
MLGRRTHRQEDKINRYIRERIKIARTEHGISQKELAQYLDKSRVAISDLERGRVQVSAADLSFIAAAVDKPITYFFPLPVRVATRTEDLTQQEQALVWEARRLSEDDLRKLTAQARALAELADHQALAETAEALEKREN